MYKYVSGEYSTHFQIHNSLGLLLASISGPLGERTDPRPFGGSTLTSPSFLREFRATWSHKRKS